MRRRAAAMMAALLALLPAAPARAHDSPALCGSQLAASAEGGVLVGASVRDARLVALPKPILLMAWDRQCRRLGLVTEERFFTFHVPSRKLRALAQVPAELQVRAVEHWVQPSLRWSPSGRRLAAGLAIKGADRQSKHHETVVILDAESGRLSELSRAAGRLEALAMIDEERAVAAFADDWVSPDRLVVLSGSEVRVVGEYESIALGPAGRAVALRSDRTLVQIDLDDGTEQPLGAKVNHVFGLTGNGRAALVSVPLSSPRATAAFAAVPIDTGPLLRWSVGAGGGSIEAAELGLAPAGQAALGTLDDDVRLYLDYGRGAPRLVYDAGRYPATAEPPSGGIGEPIAILRARLAADLGRAVLIEEAYLGRLSNRRCTWSWQSELRLVELTELPSPSPQRFARRLRTKDNCAVE